MRLRFAILSSSLAVLAIACGRREEGSSVASASSTPSANPAASASPAPAAANGTCPANGLWAECSILKRLDQAGLAPRRDSGSVREEPLTRAGMRVHLGSADVEIFIYPDSASRKADEARLDRHKFITADQEPSLAAERTMIDSANLLALLNSRDDHQRERVSDAITAGPPQP